MSSRWRTSVVVLCVLLAAALAEETPPGLVSKDSEQDLIAEASSTGAQAQKREAGLSNSYGEPLPADAYGPPQDIGNIIPDLQLPAPIYGVPLQDTPPGAYGPPSPVVFPSQTYEGPPPPIIKPRPVYGPPKHHAPKPVYGPPKQTYGPPKQTYGPPKQIYGPPKPVYGPPKKSHPPKLSLPKPTYGVPFKPPKLSHPKPIYGVPKPVYGPPKPVYGPPKQTYGPPLLNVPNLPIPELPPITTSIGSVSSNIDFGLNLPAPIYGTPLTSLPGDLKPNFPIPSDTYGPPGHILGPIGPNDQVVVHDSNIGHYGPPQPDPNPRPPHPGIPAPPTPPHVLYDGWKPIPGISKPSLDVDQHIGDIHFGNQHIGDQYGPPPPPPPIQELHLNLDQGLPSLDQPLAFGGGAQITTGYSSVHQDALANIDLNAIVGGDSNHIDQSKTVFEAHYTENNQPHDITFIHNSGPTGFDKPIDTYSAPPLDSLSNGPYPPSIRQHGAKGLVPPSGVYGVPPGSQYGAPPKPPPSNLPLPYGSYSGGGHSIHTGGSAPRHPVKFRESVPEGLIQQVGHVTSHKDVHSIDHFKQGPTYLPPPIRDIKDTSQQTSNHGISSLSLSIEPSNLYSLPHAGNPINFQTLQQTPSNLYGSPIDSYSAPLLTVADHAASGSNTNSVTATVDGTILANLSNLDAAAILKHCPYHEAILKAAKLGDKIPSDLASSYVASLSSLGSTLSKNQQTLISQNAFNTPIAGSESVSYNTKDLATASHTLVETIVPSNDIKKERNEKGSFQKAKALGKHNHKDNRLQFVSEQIQQTSEKIRNLSEEAKQLQQKIVTTNQNINSVNGHIGHFNHDIPVKGKHGSYSLQIQSAGDGLTGKGGPPAIPHEQLLSEGLLQSILQAIEQPSGQATQTNFKVQPAPQNNFQPSSFDFANIDNGGLTLPAGYEPIDRTKEKKNTVDQEIQSTNKDIKTILNREMIHKHRGDISDCDLRADASVQHAVVVPPPKLERIKPVEEIDDNDVAIFFGDSVKDGSEKNEPVTEISVATSISENINEYSDKKAEFGDKIVKS